MEQVREWLVNCDGLCEPKNPGGTATYGWLIRERGAILAQGHAVVGSGEGMTNNVAEYHSLIAALRWILQADRPPGLNITIRMDSQLVVNQVGGFWAVRSPNVYPLYEQACGLIRTLRDMGCWVDLRWVPREHNAEADALSRKAYEEHLAAKEQTVHQDSRRQRADGLPVTANGDGTYAVRSASNPDLVYQVDPRTPLCTCPDFQRRRKPCKHLYAVEAALKRPG